MPSEDYVVTHIAPTMGAAVVADGAGSSKAGLIAAQILAPRILHWICESFEEICYGDGEIVRRKAVQIITKCLRTYAVDHDIDETELACTLSAAAMDSKGRCLCINLGDGIILRQKEGHPKNVADIVSRPENGLIANSTYLTMNCNMWEHIRFYRWMDDTTTSIIMMTDGASEHIAPGDCTDHWHLTAPCQLDTIHAQTYLEHTTPEDDYSFAMIVKKL